MNPAVFVAAVTVLLASSAAMGVLGFLAGWWASHRSRGRASLDGHYATVPRDTTTKRLAGQAARQRPPAQPGPGLTGPERYALDTIARARIGLSAQAQANGQRVADGLRLLCPDVPDVILGRIVLDLLRWMTAALHTTHDHSAALQLTSDAYGLAAEELTRIGRHPEAQHPAGR